MPRFAATEPIVDEPSSDPAVAGQSSRRARSHPGTGASLPGVTRPSAPRPLGRRRLAVGAAFVASVLAASAALWVPWRARSADPSVAPIVLTTTTPPPPPAPPPPAPRRVVLRVRASPPEARLFLDGAPLDGNPFAGVLTSDGEPHEIRIERAGSHHASRSALARSGLDARNRARGGALCAPRPPARAGGEAADSAAAAAPAAQGDHGKRSLDGANPYEQ